MGRSHRSREATPFELEANETGGHTPAVLPTEPRGNAAALERLGLGPAAPDDHEPAGPTAPLTQDEATVPRGGGTWTVQRGDTLWRISERTYGHGRFWPRIRAANPRGVVGQDTIHAGRVLSLPVLQVPATGSPSVEPGNWTVAAVRAILDQGSGRAALDKIARDRIRIVRFDTAFDIWEYDDGRRETQELVNLGGNTAVDERTIRIRTSLSDTQAALTLYHELNHWGRPEATTQREYLDEEIDVRVQTEQFAIQSGLPETVAGYRNPDGTVNRQRIADQVNNSSHYNPTGRQRVGREYAGEVPTHGWTGP